MGKDSRHRYHGQTIYFGTKHDKAKAIAPSLEELGIRLETVEVDTDQFGTFTGEIERKGTVKETLRRKIEAVASVYPKAHLFLASEGSFGPHPQIGFIQSDLEALLLVDKKMGIELFVDDLTTETNHHQIDFGPKDDLQKFLSETHFPSHALIARPKGNDKIVFKGLDTMGALGQAMIECFQHSPDARVILSTDMRACYNPSRMKAIAKVGSKLLERLKSDCPNCGCIGFGPVRGVAGLPCSHCGVGTQVVKNVIWRCIGCSNEESRSREDGLSFADPAECDFCNP